MAKNSNPILYIDTSDYEQVRLALIDDQTSWHKFESRNLSEQLLPEIKKFCKKRRVELNDLKKIAVVTGPGGFSRLRTAVATANALAFGLGISVVGLKVAQARIDLQKLLVARGQKIVKPFYGKDPNITLPKK